MNYQLTGEYECKMDAKGRIRMPSDLITQLDDEIMFTINRGYENHLMLYPKDVWEVKANEINRLNLHKSSDRQLIRYFYRGATRIKMDSADRILIPKQLISYAGLKKSVILFAYQEQIELWSKKQYDLMLSKEPENFSQLADQVFGPDRQDEKLKS
jgi:MraZ protein